MLVGRESERQLIDTLLAGARVGDSRVLVLSGEPGIGKTALLAEAAELGSGMRVLRASGVETEALVPFGGLLQLLRPVLALIDRIPGPQCRALGAALLLDGYGEGEPSRFAVGAATLSLLSRAAEERPLAVLVDDAHLLDRPSAEALVFAARRLVSDPVAVVLAVRPGTPGASVHASLPTVPVPGLRPDAARALLHESAGRAVREEVVQRLHAATGGNPLALLELGERFDRLDRLGRLDTVPVGSPLGLPEQLSRSFLGRVEELSDGTRTALLVAATDGTSVTAVHQACLTLGLPAARLVEAEDAGLVSVRGDQVLFRHPLVRSAVYAAADAETRRAVHRALAAALPPDDTDRLTWHLAEGAVAPDEKTAAALERVAGRASSRGAHSIAATAYERAAALAPASSSLPRRLASAGEAAWLAGATDRAVELLERALRSSTDPVLRAHLQELRGAVETRCGSLDKALARFLQAARDVEEVSPDTAVRLYADAVHVSLYLAAPAAAMTARAAIERLLDGSTGGSTDPDARALGDLAAGMALVLAGSGAPGIERVRDAAYRLVLSGDAATERFRLPLRVQGALWLRSSSPVRAALSDAIDRMRDEAALGSLPYLCLHVAREAATTDRWDDAEAVYLEGIRLARETGQSTDMAASIAGLACLNARRGRSSEVRAGVAEAEELCRANHIRLGSLWLEFAQGDLAAGLGDPAGAVVHYEALESLLAETGFADPDQSCAPELVECYLHLGRLSEAEPLAAAFHAKASAKGQPWSLARAERAAALCASGPGAEQHFQSALELHAQTEDRFERARTELTYGGWLRRSRRRVEARPVLRAALRTFEELGADPWADRAVHELRATGETAQRREAGAMEALTPQERQIAQLLARGRTTREAAAALFLSPKTVEYHLRHVYQKLGIRSRTALADLFSAPQPPDAQSDRG